MHLNLLQNTWGCFQEIAGKTIESELFNALKLTRLIESRETSNYHRCGRTDRGVSAFRQVVSIDVRSNLIEGEGVFDYEGCRASERVQALNGNHFSLSINVHSNLMVTDHMTTLLGWVCCFKLRKGLLRNARFQNLIGQTSFSNLSILTSNVGHR